jgi:hypothetical protein
MPAAHVLMGDITDAATEAQDTLALAFIDDLPAPVYAIAGSHDIWGDARTPAEWATVYSMPAADYIVDLTFCKLICLSQVSATSGGIAAGRLTWIGDALTAASPTPCLICFHFPLYDTTLSSDSEHYYSSTDEVWYAYNVSAIRAMLDDHANAIAWVQAHIHAPYTAPQFIGSRAEGAHTMAYISTSSPYYTDKVTGENLLEAIVSVYVTIPTSGPLQIGVRDHLTQSWIQYYSIAVG